MAVAILQNSFLGGEIAPSLYGRIDDKLVSVGAAELTNFLIQPSGAIKKRSGFQFIKDLGSARFRLIPFRFSSEQTLVIALGDKIAYFITQGQFIMSGSTPYTITTPYSEAEVWDLNYSQNADVVTLTSASHAPMELRRYGATDWRMTEISTVAKTEHPTNVTAAPTYPPIDSDDLTVASEQRDAITARYVVTSVGSDGVESEASDVAVTKCNYYITGSTVEVSWTAAAGAVSYRVYRYTSGVYGFLAQTDQCSISDTGSNPDTSMTPPTHHEAFIGAPSNGEIISITVIDGGEEYTSSYSNDTDQVIYLSFVPTLYFEGADNTAGSIEEAQKHARAEVTFVSPDGTNYYGAIAYSAFNSGGGGGKERSSMACDTYDASKGFPIKLSGSKPDVGEGWRVKMKFTTEGSEWWTLEPREASPTNCSPNMAAHAKLSTNSEISKHADMWGSESGIDAARVVSSLAGNFETFPLKISGGTGASAQATVVNGSVQSVQLLAGGRGYSTNSTVTVDAPKGSGAEFKITIKPSIPAEYPRCSGQFDQRRVFAGSNKNPLKIWMTNPSNQSLMMTHTPIQADDRIEVVAVAEDADMIRHIIGMESLVMLTGSGEMRVMAVNGGALTPMTVGVRAQSYIGANEVKPVIVGSNIVYVAARGGHPRQVIYSDSSASYTSSDLGIRCPHMFDNKNIVDMTITKSPVSMVWAVSSDGMMYVATFLPDQNINAWQRIDVGGKIESVCAVAEGIEDHVYITVRRNGKCCLERMADLIIHDDTQARMADSFLDATFEQPAATISGLDHLEGQEVSVHVDGEYRGTAIVEHGIININPAGKNVCIGLPYITRLITIPLEYGSQSVVLKNRNINSLSLRVTGSGGIWYGVYPLHLNETMYQAKRNTTAQEEQNPTSKVLTLSVRGVWDKQSQIKIENRDTLPLEISSVLCDSDLNIGSSR